MLNTNDAPLREKIIQQVLNDSQDFTGNSHEIALIQIKNDGLICSFTKEANRITQLNFERKLDSINSIFELIPTNRLKEFATSIKLSFSGISIPAFSLEEENLENLENLKIEFFPVFNKENKVKRLILRLMNTGNGIRIENFDIRIQGIFENASIAILLAKPSGEILDSNRVANQMFNYSSIELKGLRRDKLFDKEDKNLSNILQEREVKGSVRGVLTGIRKNGEKFPVQVYSSVYIDSKQQQYTTNILIDISKQKEQEIALRKTTLVYQSLFHNHPDAVYSFDLTGKVQTANASALKLAELPNNEIEGLNVFKFIPPHEQERVRELFLKALNGEVQNYKTEFIGINGTKRIINVTNFSIIVDNEITGCFGIAKDITASEKNKDIIKESQERFKTILDQSLDMICSIDGEGYFRDVNKASYQILGYSPEELIGGKFTDLMHSEDIEITKKVAQEIMDGRNHLNFSNRYIKKNGAIVHLMWSVKWDPINKINYCVAKDASNIKASEEKLLKERNMLRTIIDNIPDYIFVVSNEHKTILSNKSFYSDYLGASNEESTLNLMPTDIFSLEEGLEIIKDNQRIIDSRIPVLNREDIIYDYKKNREVILLSKVPIILENDEVDGLVIIAKNVTESHSLQAEQQLLNKLLNSLSDVPSLKQALSHIIEIISNFFNFKLGEAWEVGYDKNVIRKISDYNFTSDVSSLEPIYSFKKEAGLPGITWSTGQIQIWKNPLEDTRFLRKGLLNKEEISLAIGVPVIFKDEVITVLTFFGNEKILKEFDIAKLLPRISYQISTNIQRKITENQLSNIFEYSPNLIAVLGLDGYIKKVNPAFHKIFGYTTKELLSIPFKEFLHPDETMISFKKLKEVSLGRNPEPFQIRCLAKNGEWKWISWTPADFIEEERILHIYGIDITPIKTANLELLKYQNIIESSKDGIGLISLERNEIYLNTALKNALEYSVSELNKDVIIEEIFLNNGFATDLFQTLLLGEYWNGDMQLKSKSGKILDYHLSCGPIINEAGELIAIFGIHNDISERKAQEKIVSEYTTRVQNILESITDGFYLLDSNWNFIYLNSEAETLLQCKKEDVLNKNIWNLFPEAEDDIFYEKYNHAVNTGVKVSFEGFYEPLNIWFEINAYPGKDGLSVYFKDITQKKYANQEIRIAKERYDLVSKATREAVYDWDINNNVLEWSEAYYSLFGYERVSKQENIENWELNIYEEDRDRVLEDLSAALTNFNQDKWECEYRITMANKKNAIVRDKGFVIRDKNGRAERMIGALQDITQLKRNEIELKLLNENLEKKVHELAVSNAELEQFAYIASHDLQEPLRMVTSFLTQLQKKYDNQLDKKAQQYIHFATDGAVRMRQIILDLLEYSRVGKMNYQFEEIDLNKMLDEIIHLHKNLIIENDAIVVYENLPTIQAAGTPLQRLLSNLLSNALKYHQIGRNPVIQIEVKEDPEFWQISVIDNGIGITEQFFDKIFVIFQRLHSKDQYTGTGIGLAICKKIVENHEGTIWVESQVDRGSTFHFTIKKQF
ncbi:PAS domain S-box protein [Gillisia sp. M10.2A]|uniref:histidine kinase n=1 Tax=Gillisia lutea TaxID=2909668 RepID=A0ABS9EIJ7_9FLAO|nr:PAS domain S-box protein [Gillisia lutea]MCF4102687.1 PAS domain S-box protein [Gillisia lutea]